MARQARVMRHSALFLLTLISTTFAGIVISAPEIEVPEPPLSGLLDLSLLHSRLLLAHRGGIDCIRDCASRNSF